MGKILLVKSLPFFNGIFKTCNRIGCGGKRPLGVLVGLNLITESVSVENDRWGLKLHRPLGVGGVNGKNFTC